MSAIINQLFIHTVGLHFLDWPNKWRTFPLHYWQTLTISWLNMGWFLLPVESSFTQHSCLADVKHVKYHALNSKQVSDSVDIIENTIHPIKKQFSTMEHLFYTLVILQHWWWWHFHPEQSGYKETALRKHRKLWHLETGRLWVQSPVRPYQRL